MMDSRQRIRLKVRELRMVARGLVSTAHPILAHIIPMRRCNLACTYCNEYDNFSPPVPIGVIRERIDKLADLGTSIVTISGGEPLMHPGIEEVIARIRHHDMIAGMITNGYLLVPGKIEALNLAGLEHLQISIDNVEPDDVSVKSLKVLRKKLEFLAEYAEFDVNINSVVGGGIKKPEDAFEITVLAQQLGFSTSLGIIHDGSGQLKPLTRREEKVYRKIRSLGSRGYAGLNWFQENLAAGRPNDWHCRAGSRYLYICEDGLVHYCSQQRGYPGIPLGEYTADDLRREFDTVKPCAPTCTIGCVQKVSMTDHWRGPQGRQSGLDAGRESQKVAVS
jgi:MoaA/NifB/PqqE/SkfB family radical SAM enzyme